ncbi:hypothetical protein FAEPRAM212_00384 [Faecalibacterium prausnitzii M21/2]|uniref:Uncharacterized protein n=1 Tax=Faecalibacterium prausnitzii M21/2 TaxID=411485 RepID=A8S722_9FIRM|nr:hypothetical protein FAEPRAM212_00384 [Faecalibacterium prausnitzii M21/2]
MRHLHLPLFIVEVSSTMITKISAFIKPSAINADIGIDF